MCSRCFWRRLGADKQERQKGRFSLDEIGASGSGMAAEDGALCQIESAAARGVGVRRLFDRHVSALQECLFAVVDKGGALWIVGKDLMGGLRAVKDDVGVVNDEESDTSPRIRQMPESLDVRSQRSDDALAENLVEFGIFLLKDGTALCDKGARALCRRHGLNECLRLREGLGKLSLNGLVRDEIEDFANATVLFRRIVPTVHAVDVMKPRGNLELRIEAAPGLDGRAALGVDGALTNGPMFLRGRVVVDAHDRKRAVRQPRVAHLLRDRDVQKKNMRSRNDGLGHFPGARLARSNRVLANTTERREKAVGDEAREPAVNAVAVEEKSVFLGLRSAELRNERNRHDMEVTRAIFYIVSFHVQFLFDSN